MNAEQPKKRVDFWKAVGGYLTIAKVRGRWHYVGDTIGASRAFSQAADEAGIHLVRDEAGRGTKVIRRLWQEHGARGEVVGAHLPKWTPETGF